MPSTGVYLSGVGLLMAMSTQTTGGQGDERGARGAPPGGGPAAPEARC